MHFCLKEAQRQQTIVAAITCSSVRDVVTCKYWRAKIGCGPRRLVVLFPLLSDSWVALNMPSNYNIKTRGIGFPHNYVTSILIRVWSESTIVLNQNMAKILQVTENPHSWVFILCNTMYILGVAGKWHDGHHKNEIEFSNFSHGLLTKPQRSRLLDLYNATEFNVMCESKCNYIYPSWKAIMFFFDWHWMCFAVYKL